MEIPRPTRFGALLGLSLFLFTVAVVGERCVRSTDHWEGFLSGLGLMVFAIVGWVFLAIPSAVIAGVYRWRKWTRWRRSAILAPTCVFLAAILADLAVHPPTPASSFRRMTGLPLPESVTEVRHSSSPGKMDERRAEWAFTCTPEETERLIHELSLRPAMDDDWFMRPGGDGWPDPATWTGSSILRGHSEGKNVSYYLRHDAGKRRVYFGAYRF